MREPVERPTEQSDEEQEPDRAAECDLADHFLRVGEATLRLGRGRRCRDPHEQPAAKAGNQEPGGEAGPQRQGHRPQTLQGCLTSAVRRWPLGHDG